ncbi:hypothetical protein KW797_04195 [Candidatus Parcubacteria bacterium]|nr:hypothetical protein [Candidatus Parcubacteria bacterium]
MINFDDFKKLDIRLGTIKEAVKIPETDRLVRLMVDFGAETRQIISGIALYYPDPSVLVGKQVPVLANLEPRMIKGYESNGMVLYAIEGETKLVTLEPSERLADGSAVR